MKTTLRTVRLVLVLFTLAINSPQAVHAQTWFLDSQPGLPFPFDPYDGAEQVTVLDASRHTYRVQDNTNDWSLLTEAKQLDAASAATTTTTTSASPMMTASSSPIDPGGTNFGTGGGGGTYTNYYQPLVFGSNDLWLELLGVDLPNQNASLRLHNTQSGAFYQLLSTNQLSSDGQHWTLGGIITGSSDTNFTDFGSTFIDTNSQMFFRAHQGVTVLRTESASDALAPNPATGDPGTPGSFYLISDDPLTNDLTVYYTMSGDAQNGVDYDTLSGVATIPADINHFTNVFINPTANNRMQDKTVTLNILQNTNYLVDQYQHSASISIFHSYTLVSVFVYQNQPTMYRPDGPPGIPAQTARFQFNRSDIDQSEYPQMTIYYTMSGTASNGVDYAFLSGSLDFSNGVQTVFLDVNPLPESVLKGIQTVTLTLTPTNYFVDTNNASQTLQLIDTSTTVQITASQDATETNAATGDGLPGIFQVHRTDDRGDFPPMTVNYQISGTASNGVDYQTLPGTVTFADGASDPVIGFTTNIFINTIEEDLLEPDETVTLTLVTNGNAYYIDTNHSSDTLTIHTTIGFFNAATNVLFPIGLDYYGPSNSLIVSFNEGSGGAPFVFARIYTNITGGATNTAVTNWSGISGLQDEVYLTTARMPAGTLTNAAGFTNGDIFFGSGTGIGWLSAGAIRSNLDWCILTNSVETNGLLLRGGLCMDQTGTFSNQLIAVTTDGSDPNVKKGIWRVDPHGHATLITNFNTAHLEGVTTLTNDVAKWGPWAGKIITGDESHTDPATGQPDPVIYTIAPNGSVTMTETKTLISGGIAPEDFQVIQTNQNLYFTAFQANTIMELPASYFRKNIGDLLVTQAGEGIPPGLFIIHWDGSNFVTTSIPLPDTVGGQIEHTTFAPVRFSPQ